MNFDKLLYGGDYCPEQWLDHPEIFSQDITYMKNAGINVVTLGVFAWSVYEPNEGEYHFEWLEEIIDNLYANGISVILATPSGARPVWMAEKYEEVLRVNRDGIRNLFGGRHNHCFTSPIYREQVRKINIELAKRFGKHPAVLMWHISNEYNGECHCRLCQNAFRTWLKDTYGTIEEINKKWWLTFWSHRYNSFNQIVSPQELGEKDVHGLNLAWKRFVTAQTADFMKAEIQALREGGATQPTTTNLIYNLKGINYAELMKHVDYVSWDSYPDWHKENTIEVAMDTGLVHDFMRCLKQKPFLLMESCPSSPNWQVVSKLKEPGLLMNASLQAIAHGSNSVQYFQIRQGRGGFEKFHGAVIDQYGGDDTRVYQEVKEIGETLDVLKVICQSIVEAQVAIVYDIESRWALEDAQGPRNKGLFYHEAVLKSYQALKRYGLNVDVIDAEKELDKYKVVVVPMLYMFRAGIEEKIRNFVDKGGLLIMTYWSGIADENDLCFMGGTPHKLMDVLGLRSEEIDGMADGDINYVMPVLGNRLGIHREYSCNHLCELVSVSDANTLMTYKSKFYAGKPALTCNCYGKGRAYYICADMEQAFYDDIYSRILQDSGIKGLMTGIPEKVEISSRETDRHVYIFAQNYGNATIKMELPAGAKIVCGESTGELKGLSTVVMQLDK